MAQEIAHLDIAALMSFEERLGLVLEVVETGMRRQEANHGNLPFVGIRGLLSRTEKKVCNFALQRRWTESFPQARRRPLNAILHYKKKGMRPCQEKK